MSTPRKDIAAAILADNPDCAVFPWPADLSEIEKPTVIVYRTDIVQEVKSLKHELTVQVYGRGTGGPETEDELDDVLDKVMLSLRRLDVLEVTKAERKTFGTNFQGWELAVSWASKDFYKSTVITERTTP